MNSPSHNPHCMSVCLFVCAGECVNVNMCVCMCMCVCECVCVIVNMCVWWKHISLWLFLFIVQPTLSSWNIKSSVLRKCLWRICCDVKTSIQAIREKIWYLDLKKRWGYVHYLCFVLWLKQNLERDRSN